MTFTDEFILLPGTPIGDLQIRYYGIIIVTAMLVAAWVATRLAQREGRDPDHIWGGLTWAILPGIAFARLWFILFPPLSLTAGCDDPNSAQVCMDTAWFFQNFFNLNNGAIAVWSGGLHIFGAVLGGLLGVWLYLGPLHNPVGKFFHVLFLPITIPLTAFFWLFEAGWQAINGDEVQSYEIPKFETDFPDDGMPMAPWLDIAGVVLPLAQAIGRFANYVNEELYGTPTELPWGITISPENRIAEYESLVDYPIDTTFHPLFLYEALWNFVAFFVLLKFFSDSKDRFRTGDFFLLYLIQYSFIRFWLEFIRVAKAYIPGTDINSSQVVAAIVFVVALGVFLYRRTQAPQTTQQKPKEAAEETA
jgi:phosphatidylglycerol:prolipoprotein diacylglycerol transferase